MADGVGREEERWRGSRQGGVKWDRIAGAVATEERAATKAREKSREEDRRNGSVCIHEDAIFSKVGAEKKRRRKRERRKEKKKEEAGP